MSAIDLIADIAVDEYHERRKLLLEYQRAAAAVTTARIEVDTWERHERNAKADLRKVVAEFEKRGWSLP